LSSGFYICFIYESSVLQLIILQSVLYVEISNLFVCELSRVVVEWKASYRPKTGCSSRALIYC